MAPMSDDTIPQPTTGSDLAEMRRAAGVAQQDVARVLGVHRITLNKWEGSPQVDTIRAARYQRAVRELVHEAIAS